MRHSEIVLIVVLLFVVGYSKADVCTTFNATLDNNVCNITYNVSSTVSKNNTLGDSVRLHMDYLFQQFDDYDHPALNHSCGQFYVAFYCSDYYPKCTSPNATYDSTRACASACNQLVTACAPFQWIFTAANLTLPTHNDCNTTYSFSQNCTFNLDSANVYKWYPGWGDNSSSSSSNSHAPIPNTSSNSNSSSSSEEKFDSAGAGLAAGLLVVLLLFIAGIGLVMKRQENK